MKVPGTADVPRIGAQTWNYPTAGSQYLAQSYGQMADVLGMISQRSRALNQRMAAITTELLKNAFAAGEANQFSNAQMTVQKRYQDWIQDLPQLEIREQVGIEPATGEAIYGEPNYDRILDHFDAFEARTYEEIRKGITYAGAKAQFDKWYALYMPGKRQDVIGVRVNRELNQIDADFMDRVATYTENRDLRGLERDLNDLVRRGFILPNKAKEFLSNKTIEIHRLQALDQLQQMPYDQGLMALRSGQFKEQLPTMADVAAVEKEYTYWYGLKQQAEQQVFDEKNQEDFRYAWDAAERGVYMPRAALLDPTKFALTDNQVQFIMAIQERKTEEGLQLAEDQKNEALLKALGQLDVKIGNRELSQNDVDAFIAAYPTEETAIRYLTKSYQYQTTQDQASAWDARMAQLALRQSLTQEAVDKTANHPLPEVRDTARYWAAQFEQQEAGKARGAAVEVDRQLESDLIDMIRNPNMSLQDIQRWFLANIKDENGVQRISYDKAKQWYFGIEDWRKDPGWFVSLTAGLKEKGNAYIKEKAKLGPNEAGKAAERVVTDQQAARELLEQGRSQEEIRAFIQNRNDFLDKEIQGAKTRWWILPDRSPEDAMADWAENNRLDEFGRIIGLPFEQQLDMLNIESFDDFNWQANIKQRGKLAAKGIHPERIAEAPPAWWEFSYQSILDQRGQPVMAQGPDGMIWAVRTPEGREVWVTASGEILADAVRE